MRRLSVIVPVYKVEKYLTDCIESILAQTFTDFELILVDDGSPDCCGKICDEYANRDERIKVLHQKNVGVSAARNVGLDIAEGVYIGFIDPDDWIEPDMFQAMIQEAERKNADVIICGVNYCEESGTFIRSAFSKNEKYDQKKLQIAIYGKPTSIGGGVWNKFFLRSQVKDVRFRPELRMAEDWVYLFDCFQRCNVGFQIEGRYYNVRERADSATRSNEIEAIYDRILGGKLLLLLSQNVSGELEAYAMDKYLDDCIRYSNLLRNIGKKTGQSYRWKYIKIRLQILQVLPRAYFCKLLSKEKLHGYLFELFRI